MARLLIPQTIQLLIAVWGISLMVFLVNFVIGDPLTGLIDRYSGNIDSSDRH